jgi:multiple sugar transport system ATP-binding protein
MGRLVLRELWKRYHGDVDAVRGVNLEIQEREFLVLLGPSGCGKTTVLRMVAGLEEISAGSIELDDRLLNDVPERDRDIAMVFQNYALYPHMSVYRNIEFPLRHRGVPRGDREKLVREVAATLGLDGLLGQRPAQLSGGQRQRVAMGRAMVRRPKAFLMDEPLSNLDAALRVQMRTEIHSLQRRLGVTTMYVTHDQVEAMTLGDRVAVMRDGVLQQVGPPDDVYQRPANAFVGAFMGSPGMTMFECPVERQGDDVFIRFGEQTVKADELERTGQPALARCAGGEVVVGVRPEAVELCNDTQLPRRLRARVEFQEVLGSSVVAFFFIEGSQGVGAAHRHGRVAVDLDGDEPDVSAPSAVLTPGRFPASVRFTAGETLDLSLAAGAMRFFDRETGNAL